MQKYSTKTISSSELPEIFAQLHKPVSSLKYRGNKDLLSSGKRVGVIGARKFTPYGREVTTEIVECLVRNKVTVVSGLAIGIDSIAHSTCVNRGGKTIAVLPSGLSKVYPSSHKHLADKILDNSGLLISEYEENHIPRKFDFIERNRIIAALSDILIVTEASIASGSLHTASFALEMGLTVMAVPGNIYSPTASGVNKLIQNGAFPVLNAEAIIEALGISSTEKLEYLPANDNEKTLLEALKKGPKTTEELIKLSLIHTQEITSTLTLLEINDVISIQSGIWKLK